MTDIRDLVDTVLEVREIDSHLVMLRSSRHDDNHEKVFLKAGAAVPELCPGRHNLLAVQPSSTRRRARGQVLYMVLCPNEDSGALVARARKTLGRFDRVPAQDVNVDTLLDLHAALLTPADCEREAGA